MHQLKYENSTKSENKELIRLHFLGIGRLPIKNEMRHKSNLQSENQATFVEENMYKKSENQALFVKENM